MQRLADIALAFSRALVFTSSPGTGRSFSHDLETLRMRARVVDPADRENERASRGMMPSFLFLLSLTLRCKMRLLVKSRTTRRKRNVLNRFGGDHACHVIYSERHERLDESNVRRFRTLAVESALRFDRVHISIEDARENRATNIARRSRIVERAREDAYQRGCYAAIQLRTVAGESLPNRRSNYERLENSVLRTRRKRQRRMRRFCDDY